MKYISHVFLYNFIVEPLYTVIVDYFFVSVKVDTGALFRTQSGQVVVFNTHSFLAPILGMSRAINILPALR
jgi:hypothetical protein